MESPARVLVESLLVGCAGLLLAAPAPVPAAFSGSVSIDGPSAVAVGQTIELVADGTPAGGTYSWLVESNRTPPQASGRSRLASTRVRARAEGERNRITGLTASRAPNDVRVRVRYEVDGAVCEAVKTLTSVTGDLTAYRPQHGAGYFPFARTAVPDSEEEDLDLGPGIRINGPGDTDPNGEDDLIELTATIAPAGVTFGLLRGNSDLTVWTTRTKQAGTELAFVNDAALVPFGAGQTQLTLWAEWAGTTHGARSLELGSIDAGVASDRLIFHSFESIVMSLGGEDQVPSLPVDPNHGTFVVGTALYELGYDTHLFDEDNVGPVGLGAVYDEVVNAIQNRGVCEVAIFGYSHGGGSTHDLSERLDADRLGIGVFDIAFTSYVDSVDNGSDTTTGMELRYPPTSAYHANHWQVGQFFQDLGLDGGPVPGSEPPPDGLDVETTPWGMNATHFQVDDFSQVRDFISSNLSQQVIR